MGETARILVVDDELGIREGCRRALTPQGFAVDVARDAAEGLNKVKGGGFDLVLLDVMMPGISGLDLLSMIREHDPDIVCIIITGYATVPMAVNAIKQGAYDFLTKPFTADDLLLGVNQGLERRRLLLESRRLQAAEAEARRLTAEKSRLEEIEKSKAAFLRLVTHELQAPAAAVQSYLQLILDGYIPPEQQREIIQKAAARASEEISLIADLLELGRLREARERGQVTASPRKAVHLEEALAQALDPLESQAAEKGVRLTVEGPRPVNASFQVPPVRGVFNEFKSLWANLISNAIKYTPPGGAVVVSLSGNIIPSVRDGPGGQVVGQVRDTGIGIPREARSRLFSEFFRAENAKDSSLRGTGLGLVIVKQVVEAAGGQVWVESELGQGSTFTFVLPAASEGEAEKLPAMQEGVAQMREKGGRMTLRIIDKRAMPAFVSSLMEGYQVVGPMAKDGQYAFGPITEHSQLRLDYNTTVLPPKKYLLPQEEVLFTFNTEGLVATPLFDSERSEPRVILGVHTCDLHAMRLLDAVFASGERDEHYLKRRAATLLVGIECLTPCDEHSFCKSMNTLTASDGFDLHLTDLGDRYAVEVGTSAGEALLARHGEARPATQEDAGLLNQVLSDKWPRFSYRLDFDGAELPALMAVSYKSPLWAELEQRCLACGSCNIVCPTCYCFNVRDEIALDGKTGARVRVWDSCQLDEFARVAGGESFRKTRAQRQRHRFFRKGKYIPDMHGELGCVGCGRCARACLVDITPVGVWNALHKAHEG